MLEASRQEILLALGDEASATTATDLDTLLADWDREAGDGELRDQVLDVLRDELLGELQSADPEDRADILHREAVERQVRALGRATLAAGRATLAGALSRDEGKVQGEALMARAREVRQAVEALPLGEARTQLLERVGEAELEALYVVERKAMSRRLGREAGPAGEGDGPPPPRTF